jgi:hypothetical protein
MDNDHNPHWFSGPDWSTLPNSCSQGQTMRSVARKTRSRTVGQTRELKSEMDKWKLSFSGLSEGNPGSAMKILHPRSIRRRRSEI